MEHSWLFLTVEGRAPSQGQPAIATNGAPSSPSVVAVCHECGEIRTHAIEGDLTRMRLAGDCPLELLDKDGQQEKDK